MNGPDPLADSPNRTRPDRPGGKSPRRKRSPAKPDRDERQVRSQRTPRPNDATEDVLEPAAGGPAPGVDPMQASLIQRQFTREEWEYLQNLPAGSLAEEIRLMRVLSLRLVQQGLKAEDPGDEIRYYSEATRIMARLPLLLKAEKALNAGQDEITLAMIRAINTVLDEVENNPARQLELPFPKPE